MPDGKFPVRHFLLGCLQAMCFSDSSVVAFPGHHGAARYYRWLRGGLGRPPREKVIAAAR